MWFFLLDPAFRKVSGIIPLQLSIEFEVEVGAEWAGHVHSDRRQARTARPRVRSAVVMYALTGVSLLHRMNHHHQVSASFFFHRNVEVVP